MSTLQAITGSLSSSATDGGVYERLRRVEGEYRDLKAEVDEIKAARVQELRDDAAQGRKVRNALIAAVIGFAGSLAGGILHLMS